MYKFKVQLFAFLLLFLSIAFLTGCTQNQSPTQQNSNWDIKISLKKTSSGTKPVFESNIPESVSKDQISLRILYQEPLQSPTVLLEGEIGYFSGSNDVFKEQVLLAGAKFNLGTYNIDLKPGVNAFAIDLKQQGLPYKYFSIRRVVQNPREIPIKFYEDFLGKYNTKEVLRIAKPSAGLIKGNSPTLINFDAELTENIIGDNMFKLVIGKQTNEGLREYKKITMPVKNRKISTSFKLGEPGTYQILIKSPEYFPTPEGGGSITWAEFYAEIN